MRINSWNALFPILAWEMTGSSGGYPYKLHAPKFAMIYPFHFAIVHKSHQASKKYKAFNLKPVFRSWVDCGSCFSSKSMLSLRISGDIGGGGASGWTLICQGLGPPRDFSWADFLSILLFQSRNEMIKVQRIWPFHSPPNVMWDSLRVTFFSPAIKHFVQLIQYECCSAIS